MTWWKSVRARVGTFAKNRHQVQVPWSMYAYLHTSAHTCIAHMHTFIWSEQARYGRFHAPGPSKLHAKFLPESLSTHVHSSPREHNDAGPRGAGPSLQEHRHTGPGEADSSSQYSTTQAQEGLIRACRSTTTQDKEGQIRARNTQACISKSADPSVLEHNDAGPGGTNLSSNI